MSLQLALNNYWRELHGNAGIPDGAKYITNNADESHDYPHCAMFENGTLTLVACINDVNDSTEAAVSLRKAAESLDYRSNEANLNLQGIKSYIENEELLSTLVRIRLELITLADTAEVEELLNQESPVYIFVKEDQGIPILTPVVHRGNLSDEHQIIQGENILLSRMFNDVIATENNFQMLVCTIKFGSFLPFMNKYGEAIFSENVRGFLGKTITNSRLLESIRSIAEESERGLADLFTFKNNGLTIFCDNPINPKDNAIRLANPKVANGQQTLSCLKEIYDSCGSSKRQDLSADEMKANLESLEILAKVIYVNNKTVKNTITFSNNRQNSVSSGELRSNEAVFINIQNKFRDNFNNTDFNYLFKRKKGERDPREIITNRTKVRYISMDGLFRLLNGFGYFKSLTEDDFYDEEDQRILNKRNLKIYSAYADLLNEKFAKVECLKRFIGLYQINEMSFGDVRREKYLQSLLNSLGVHANTMGSTVADEASASYFRWAMIDKMWPLIKSMLLHIKLMDNSWAGCGHHIKVTSDSDLNEEFLDMLLQGEKLVFPSNFFTKLFETFGFDRNKTTDHLNNFVANLDLDDLLSLAGHKRKGSLEVLLENL